MYTLVYLLYMEIRLYQVLKGRSDTWHQLGNSLKIQRNKYNYEMCVTCWQLCKKWMKYCSLVLLNCVFLFFIHSKPKLELLTQFPASNDKIFLSMCKNKHLRYWIIGLINHLHTDLKQAWKQHKGSLVNPKSTDVDYSRHSVFFSTCVASCLK